jgi:subtilisin family serine protease
MRKKLKRQVTLIAIGLVLAALWPAGIMAENLSKSNDTEQMKISSSEDIPVLEEISDISDQVVVIYKEGSTLNVQSLGLSTSEVKAGKSVSDQVDVLEVNQGVDMDAFINTLNGNPNVLAADRNQIARKASSIPNDPYVSNGLAWQFADIGEDQTWNQVSNSDPVVVAVLDTGVNVKHPDLVGRTAAGYDYATGSTSIVDHQGHGTSVSGCIAAVANNGLGIAGVAGTANVKIASYCIGDYSDANICAALMACANRADVDIINMSYGGYGAVRTEAAAIEYASEQGKILVASAGNEGDEPEAGQYSYPASYDNVISVAAVNRSDSWAYFSQYNNKVDLTAPGQNIYTTTMTGGYESMSGTSFSTPIVAGACAVLLAKNPTLSAAEVETILEETALDLGNTGKDNFYGYGLIQVDKALASETRTETVSCSYQTHVQDYGWQNWVSEGETSGTYGQSKRLEGIKIDINSQGVDLGVKYQTHVQNIGWQDFVYDGDLSGTTARSLRLEAIRIELTGADADQYDIYYRVHAQDVGWMSWARNGENSGTAGFSRRLEGIQIVVVPKGTNPPAPDPENNTDLAFEENV